MSDITRERIEDLMKRCQIGVGGKHALDDAHDIMADCYGTLGAMMSEIEALRSETRGCAQEMATMGNALIAYSTNLDKAGQ
jgi:hypothetical protein